MKRLLLVMMVLFVVPFVHASAFSTIFTPLDNEILPNETATFELAVSNFDPVQKRFQVYSIDPNWLIKVEPISVVVPSGTTQTFQVSLKPKINVAFGSQGIAVNVKDLESGDLVRKVLFVAVKNQDGISGQYQPSVAFEIGLPQEVDPRQPVSFSVDLRNRNSLNIEELTLVLSSPHYDYTTKLALAPLAEHTEYLTLRLDSTAAAGDYVMSGTLRYRDLVVTQVQRGYTIGSYATIEKEVVESSFLLKNTQIVRLTNDGNAEQEVAVALAANIIQRLFSSQTPEATYRGGQYVWTITVPAGETAIVELSKNYRWFTIALIILIAALVLYFLYRSPVVALKESVGIKRGEGVGEVKLRVFVRNRTNKIIQGVDVYDKIPRIAELKKTHVLGTIKPTKVSKVKSGTLLHWNLDILEPYEERILTYTVASKLQIVGKVQMPEAKIKFETGKGQERVVYSDNILVVEK